MTLTLGAAVLAWLLATAAGADLVTVVQSLISRPLVAGVAAGWLLGDVATGLRVGALLELFALDVVPVGSSRYPDFGAATVAAVWYAAGSDWTVTLGAATALGLALAQAAGATLPMTRRLNARAVRSHAAGLSEGDPAAVTAVHLRCLAHDLLRSAITAAVAVAVAAVARGGLGHPDPTLGERLNLVLLGGAAWAVAHGAMASARSGPRWRWALAGLAAGTAMVLVR
jgi:mannose/fructose/N-acetylgalactosamine-specific phosphotransferase system component IIC